VASALPQRELDLLHVMREVSGAAGGDVLALAASLLRAGTEGSRDSGEFRSHLNNDGSPLQVCLSSSRRDGIRCRLLGDPNSEVADSVIRLHKARAVLERAARASVAADLWPALERTVSLNLPPARAREALPPAGALWLGRSLREPGLALYVNAAWGDAQARWRRTIAWLAGDGDTNQGASPFDRLRMVATVASVGLEGVDRERVRRKVYFRLRERRALADLNLPLFCTDAMSSFVRAVMSEVDLPLQGILLCVGFAPGALEVCDTKLDICGHCLERKGVSWPDLLQRLERALGLPMVDVAQLELNQRTEIAFVGCGVRSDGSARLNVYLKGHAVGHAG
jgi:hypothetical protein